MEYGYQATCQCGFREYIEVGSPLGEFPRRNNHFPFYCKTCGVVPVNIALEHKVCPTCSNKEVTEYGIPPLSTEVRCETNSSDSRRHEKIIEAWEGGKKFQVSTSDNFCPKCNNMSMRFLYLITKDSIV